MAQVEDESQLLALGNGERVDTMWGRVHFYNVGFFETVRYFRFHEVAVVKARTVVSREEGGGAGGSKCGLAG